MPDNAPTQAELKAWLDQYNAGPPTSHQMHIMLLGSFPRLALAYQERMELIERLISFPATIEMRAARELEAAEALRKWRGEDKT